MQTDEEVGKVAQAVPVIIYILLNKTGLCMISVFFMFIAQNICFGLIW